MATKKRSIPLAGPQLLWDQAVIVGGQEETTEPTPAPAPPSGVMRRVLGDGGISLLKGAIGVPEAAVGLADIATGGRVGRFLENEGGAVGFRPDQARKILDEALTPEQQAANRAVQEADGFTGKLGAAVANPSTVATTVTESLPLMLGGAGVAGGLMRVAPRMGVIAAGAAGEGIVGAGSAASQIRQETDDRLLTAKQAGLAVASGVGTGVLSVLGGKVAQRLGIGDVDTLLAQAMAGRGAQQVVAQQTSKGLVRKVLEGAVSEGVLEELPQSIQEQVLQNAALNKPLDEGVDYAAVMGLLSGAAMGGVAAPLARPGDALRQDKLPEVGPMSRAVNAAVEAAAQKADAGAPIPADPAAPPVQPPPAAPAARAPLAPAGPVGVLYQPGDTTNPVTGERIPAPAAEVPPVAPVEPAAQPPAAARAQREADKPADPTGEAQDGDILNAQGRPFKSMDVAMRRLAEAGGEATHEIKRVRGGLVVRPKADAAPAADAATEEPAPAAAKSEPDAPVERNAFGMPIGFRPGARENATVADLKAGDWIEEGGKQINVRQVTPKDDGTFDVLADTGLAVSTYNMRGDLAVTRRKMERTTPAAPTPAATSTFTLDGKTWTLKARTDAALIVSDGEGPDKKVAPGSKLGQRITAALGNLPAEPAPAPTAPAATSDKDTPPVAPGTAVAPPQGLQVTFGGKTYPVESVNDAQAKWVAFRDSADGGMAAGVSQVGNGIRVTDANGKFVARISYNGRAWNGEGDDAKVLAEAPDGRKMPQAIVDDEAKGVKKTGTSERWLPPKETLEEATARSEKDANDQQRTIDAVPPAPRTVTVAGEQVALTPEQGAEWDKTEAEFKAKFDAAKAQFERDQKAGNPADPDVGYRNAKEKYEAERKALGMQLSAERRRIAGKLTPKEQKTADQQAARVRNGDTVETPQGTGTVTGNAFGRVRVRIGDRTVVVPFADAKKVEKAAQADDGEEVKFSAWADIGRGYQARQSTTHPTQQIKTPGGNIITRGLDTNGKEYTEFEGSGDPTARGAMAWVDKAQRDLKTLALPRLAAEPAETPAPEPEVISSQQPLSDAEQKELDGLLGLNGAVGFKDMGGHWRAEATGNSLRSPVRAHGSNKDAARRNLLAAVRQAREAEQSAPPAAPAPAPAQQPQAGRPDELIELRKRLSVLESIRRCVG